ncbi:Flagellar basal-body rod protein FlgF [hydrothermal vent metagenome]|uniref:Flagellar basal-body rod protein FlgF n=1 Tax=hydrothermal vent metagenome TaxID=652676 RepID=A0A3B0Y2N5_9ZZZZ
MDRMLYIAMAGAKQAVRAQTVNANNLANSSTVGFRADIQFATDRQVYGDGYSSRAYNETVSPGINFTEGGSMSTGRSLDVIVSPKGYITVQTATGKEAYTRAGNFKVTANGLLQTASGHSVIGNNGPIALPPYDKLEIGSDGTITILPKGQTAASLSVIDRIKLVTPKESELLKNTQGLLVLPEGAAVPAPDPKTRLTGGMLETSNVNSIESLILMMDIARQYETNIKLMKSAKENDAAVAQLLRSS